MNILGVATTMEVVMKHDPKRHKLEYVEMKVEHGAFSQWWTTKRPTTSCEKRREGKLD